MKKIPWVWFDHRADLPKWLTVAIGQVAVEWSILERELEEIIRLLMDDNIKIGRIATTGMNTRTRVLVATNLIQTYVYNRKLPSKFLGDFIKLGKDITEKAESERNKLIHGLWGRDKRSWYVLRTTGSRAIPELHPELKKTSRAVLPQREKVTSESLEVIIQNIAATSQRVEATCQSLEAALAPLQHKPPQYTRHRRLPRAHNKKAPLTPLRSSRP